MVTENTDDKIEIPVCKVSATLAVLLMAGISVIIVYLVYKMIIHHVHVEKIASTGHIIGLIILVAVCAYMPGWIYRKFFKNGYGLIIDNNGITDNVSKTGLIPWDDICEIEIVKVVEKHRKGGTTTSDRLGIFVSNYENYISGDTIRKSSMGELEVRLNCDTHSVVGIPVLIPFHFLKYKDGELLIILSNELAKRRAKAKEIFYL